MRYISEYAATNEYMRELNKGQIRREMAELGLGNPDDVVRETDSEIELRDGTVLVKTPPGQPTVPDLIKIGDIIKTSYGTGPYKVVNIIKSNYMGGDTWSFILSGAYQRDMGRKFYINNMVAINGVIRHQFKGNGDSIQVIKPATNQIDVFGGIINGTLA